MPRGKSKQQITDADRQYMRMALAMAQRGLGTTAPNPSVGAVIVDDKGEICGRGWTQPGGRPHAEIVALDRAGGSARGATLYVTLEPCSHHGKSPPCADAVIEAGIKRVACAIRDPHELVAGQGLERLREAGIEVEESVLADEAHWLTLGHILAKTQRRPFVQLKVATGRDGLIAAGDGAPVWVTGPDARAQGHLLRAKADAILVGIGTVLADDPSLDCRLPGLEARSPKVFVLDSHCRLPLDAKLVKRGSTLQIASAIPPGDEKGSKEAARAQKLRDLEIGVWLAAGTLRVPLAALLAFMADSGITRLLVEGGPHVWRSFLDEGLVDEIIWFKGAGDIGNKGLQPFNGGGMERLDRESGFEMVDQRAVGDDKMIVYRSTNSMKAD